MGPREVPFLRAYASFTAEFNPSFTKSADRVPNKKATKKAVKTANAKALKKSGKALPEHSSGATSESLGKLRGRFFSR